MAAAAQLPEIFEYANSSLPEKKFRGMETNDVVAREGAFAQQAGRAEKPAQVLTLENELRSLCEVESEEDVMPTYYALILATETVLSAYNQLFTGRGERTATKLPAPTITTDDVGGIMASWKGENKYLVANFGADEGRKSFLYWSMGGDPKSSPIDDLKLQQQLHWLTEP